MSITDTDYLVDEIARLEKELADVEVELASDMAQYLENEDYGQLCDERDSLKYKIRQLQKNLPK